MYYDTQERMRRIYLYVSISISVILFSALIISSLKTERFHGTELNTGLKQHWELSINSSTPYTMELAGRNFFLLESEDYIIAGSPTERPLGYQEDFYFFYNGVFEGPTEWIARQTDQTELRITSETPISATLRAKSIAIFLNSLLISLLGIIVWGFFTLMFWILTEM
jgi:hypothetical protein